LAEYYEVAGLLANEGGEAPPALWDSIAAHLGDVDAVSPFRPAIGLGPLAGAPLGGGKELAPRRRGAPRFVRFALTAVAAAAAAAVVVLSVQVHRLDQKTAALSGSVGRAGISQAVTAALLDPRAQRVALMEPSSDTGSRTAMDLVIVPGGRAYVVDDRLPALTSARTYQLWARVGDRYVSLSVLGPRPGDTPFSVDPSTPVTAFAVTIEAAGGAVRPSGSPVARGAVSA
jgi:anti-sigma-K factor RskA